MTKYATEFLSFFFVLVASSFVTAKEEEEIWFGWVEAPNQQLRTIIKIDRKPEGSTSKPSGTILSPDQSSTALALSDLAVEPEVASGWKFNLKNEKNEETVASYVGTQVASDRVDGTLQQAGISMQLNLAKVQDLPKEQPDKLNADAVWNGSLDLGSKKLDLRIRIYSQPPFASIDAPRFLFDSITERSIGTPVEANIDFDRTATFAMNSIGAQYVAKLNDEGDVLEGNYTKNKISFPLVMKLNNDQLEESGSLSKETVADTSTAQMSPASESIPSPTEAKLQTTDRFEEKRFEVMTGPTKRERKTKNPDQIKLAISKVVGTLTLPKQPVAGHAKHPAVILLSGNGPQDRDETVGKHKPFEAIAHFLAEKGVASLRYDDRGVGESSGDFFNSTSEDFARDALAVWNFAASIPEIDVNQIGLLGHSEGGMVAPLVASWEPKVAFLILIAPPGISGGEVLKAQFDHMAKMQGESEASRKVTMKLQQELQDIASGYFVDDAAMTREIRSAINLHWKELESVMAAIGQETDVAALKQQMTNQLSQQVSELRKPWYKFYLHYDPSAVWLLLKCPTLALWGEKDAEILPEANLKELREMSVRNTGLEVSLQVLPDLNHLLQKCESGSPAEYEQIEESISPKALEAILKWLIDQNIASNH